jgi:hypothetical protein
LLLAGLTGALLTSGHSVRADSLTPLADTWLQNGSTANNSADANLRVKNQNNQLNDRVTFLRFDGSGLTGGNVSVASLFLTVSAFSTPTAMTFQLFGIVDGGGNEAFDATTLTFANSGYTDQSVDNNVNDSLFSGGAPLATATLLGTDPAGTVLTFSGSSLVNFLNANQNSDIAFVLTTSTLADSVFVTFGSMENATAGYQPTLTYSTTSVPEPSTLSFALASGLGLLLVCRRRA